MKKNFAILLLFLLFTGLRLFHINADPPDDLSFSAGIFVDEMHNVHQVRNKILFGSATLDRYPSFAYSPIFGILQYVILSIIGIGLWQIKVLPILLSIISLLLVYRSFSEHFDDRYGKIAAILLGFNYTFIMYNRLGLYENLVIFFMTLTLFFWQRAVNIRRLFYFYLTGLSAGFVFIAKNIAFYFVISVALSFFIHIVRKGLKISLKPAFIGLFGAVTAGAIWFVGCYLPFKADVTNLGSSWLKSTVGAATLWQMLETNPLMPLFIRFKFLPLTLLLSLIFVAIVIYRFSINPRKVDDVELFILLWFFGGLFFLGLLSYSPTRYYLPILPAIVLLATLEIARYGGKTESIRFSLSDWRLCLISFLSIMILSFYFILPYIKKFRPQTASFFFLDELTKSGTIALSAFVGIIFLLIAGGVTWMRRTNTMIGTITYLFSVFFFSLVILFALSHPLRAKIEVELNSGQNGKMRFYWGGTPPSYNEIDSNGIRIKKGSGIYSTLIGNLHSIRHLRIDPLTRKGEVLIKTIKITQPGFKPIVFQTRQQFQRFVPLHQIGQMHILANGLKVSSLGVDPYFHTKLPPVFKRVLFAKYFLYQLLRAIGIVLIFSFYLLLMRRLKKNSASIAFNNSNIGRKRFAGLIMAFIITINMFHYIKWIVQGNYAIYKTSNEIGRRLPPDAMIAGQGVMAATIENRLRHVQAPNWYEDKKKLFLNYPITYLFLSHYAGYFSWYQRHYPNVMKNSEIIGVYRILNRDFYLLKINVPDDKKTEAFRWK